MYTTSWKQLPNAKHINAILMSLEKDPSKWAQARDAVRSIVPDRRMKNESGSAIAATNDLFRISEREQALNEAWNNSRAPMCMDAYVAASAAIIALVAWDNSTILLDNMDFEQAKLLAAQNNNQAMLLLPAMFALS